ncbi:MAG: hypothetical protein Kow0096_10100 [Thiohalomonadaceae bacterium]
MSNTTFAVIFSGQLVEGARVEQVQANFSQLFKVELSRITPMFCGKPVTIKKGIDEATAKKYQQALLQAGAICQVVDLAAATPAAAQQAPAAPAADTAPVPVAAAPAGGLNATLAEPGAIIKEPEEVPPLQVDISHLSMGEVGETIIEPTAPTELEVDVSALSLAEPGVLLVPPSEVEALQVDVSALSMAEPGVILKEPEQVEPPQIDISKISLA